MTDGLNLNEYFKICSKCKEEKHLDNFYKSGKNGRRSECKSCSKGASWYTSKRTVNIIDKKEKTPLSFTTLENLADDMLGLLDTVESKQREATHKPVRPDKWLGMAVLGDMHFGDFKQDLKTINKHTDMILERDDVIVVQVGDILHEEGSLTHRGKSTRPPPFEFPLHVARKACAKWFNKIKTHLAAFVIGGHDERPIRSELYDIGEEMVDIIDGVYLGYNGFLHIEFPDVIYDVFIDHAGSGFSHWNPLHAGARADKELPLDIFVFGHIHDGVHYNDLARKMGNRVASIRASGYDRAVHSRYGWKINPMGFNVISTPIVLLNPNEKEWIIFRKIEYGLLMLDVLNQNT